MGTAVLIWAFNNKIEVKALADNSPEKINKSMMGVKIRSIDEVADVYGNDVNYITAALDCGICNSVYQQLSRHGISNLNVFNRNFIENQRFERCFNYKRILDSPAYEIIQHEYEINNVISSLADSFSIEVYSKMLSRRYTGRYYTVSSKYYSPNEGYFGHEFLDYTQKEVLLQCGVLDGRTIRQFIKKCPNYERIIGIEADGINYAKSIGVTSLPKVSLINAAIFSRNGEISFDNRGDGMSRVSLNGASRVNAIKGDDLFSAMGIVPTMIQMDIEGAELDALQGLESTIRNNKPKLAICIYHSIKDYWEIPLFIKRIVPEYSFYVRNDSTVNNVSETVLYAVI